MSELNLTYCPEFGCRNPEFGIRKQYAFTVYLGLRQILLACCPLSISSCLHFFFLCFLVANYNSLRGFVSLLVGRLVCWTVSPSVARFLFVFFLQRKRKKNVRLQSPLKVICERARTHSHLHTYACSGVGQGTSGTSADVPDVGLLMMSDCKLRQKISKNLISL